MKPAIRTQADERGDEYSKKAAIVGDGTPSLTRQEQKNDADINVLLSRFGVNQQIRTGGRFGEHDDQLDLHTALQAVAAARTANFNVPDELREKYPDWKTVLAGAENGSYEKDLEQLHAKRRSEKALAEKAERRRQMDLTRQVEADMRAEAAAEAARRQTDTKKE